MPSCTIVYCSHPWVISSLSAHTPHMAYRTRKGATSKRCHLQQRERRQAARGSVAAGGPAVANAGGSRRDALLAFLVEGHFLELLGLHARQPCAMARHAAVAACRAIWWIWQRQRKGNKLKLVREAPVKKKAINPENERRDRALPGPGRMLTQIVWQ